MPPDLATIKGQVRMMYRGSDPWHRLGHRIPDNAPLSVALDTIDLPCHKTNVLISLNGSTYPAPKYSAIVRADTLEVLAVNGSTYQYIPYRETFGEMLETLCGVWSTDRASFCSAFHHSFEAVDTGS